MKLYSQIAARTTALFLLLSTIAAANPISPEWGLIDTTAPARYGFGAAYNSIENKIVLFGGADTSGQMPTDTWEWNGNSWSQAASSGPAGRSNFGMCYVDWQGLVVLFGGWSSALGYLSDTWIWDGVTWTEMNISGPPARAAFAMAYDQSSESVILFGGTNGETIFGDTWEWSGSQWSLVDTTGPPARIYSEMTGVPEYGGCLLFGGMAGYGGETLDDSWAWLGTTWFEMTTENPSPRMGHMMAYNPTWGWAFSVELFGGQDGPNPIQYFNDTWEMDETGWYLTNVDGPSARSFGKMVYHAGLEKVIIIGGSDASQIYHDMWAYPVIQSACAYRTGDANGSGTFNGLDVTFSVSYFKGGIPPPYSCECPPESGQSWYVAGDVNATCSFNGLDVTYMVAFFKGGPSPSPCPDCPPAR